MYHNFFIHSSVDGYLGYFHVLAVVAMNIGLRMSFRILVFSGYIPSYGLLDHMVDLFLVFLFVCLFVFNFILFLNFTKLY